MPDRHSTQPGTTIYLNRPTVEVLERVLVARQRAGDIYVRRSRLVQEAIAYWIEQKYPRAAYGVSSNGTPQESE